MTNARSPSVQEHGAAGSERDRAGDGSLAREILRACTRAIGAENGLRRLPRPHEDDGACSARYQREDVTSATAIELCRIQEHGRARGGAVGRPEAARVRSREEEHPVLRRDRAREQQTAETAEGRDERLLRVRSTRHAEGDRECDHRQPPRPPFEHPASLPSSGGRVAFRGGRRLDNFGVLS